MVGQCKVCEIGSTRYLLLQGRWDSCIAEVMRRYGVSHIRLNSPAQRQVRIDFLRDLRFLERVDLSALSILDITPLYDLPNLRALSLCGVKKEIDFSRIPQLEELRLDWHAKYSSLLACDRLRTLGIGNYQAADLQQFGGLRSLEDVIVSRSRIKNLAGVERMPQLRRLSLDLVARLETLKPLEACQQLQYLSIDAAKSLERINSVSSLLCLRELCLKRCPKLDSMAAIKGLPMLEYLGLLETTNIKDGDLSVLRTLVRLKHASFIDRKHYNQRSADFPKVFRPVNKLAVLYDSSRRAAIADTF